MLKRGTRVTITTGPHVGEHGEIITLPIGAKGDQVLVRRADGQSISCSMKELEIVDAAATSECLRENTSG